MTGRYQWTRQIFESDDVVRGEQARQNNRRTLSTVVVQRARTHAAILTLRDVPFARAACFVGASEQCGGTSAGLLARAGRIFALQHP